ncbi:MarR family transcriptional regulator [Nocardioides zeae]|uniref:MarR family transcriptional regulator n=1 Tax=Nocardioides imazamoxiresistens TaxID=3231893 RepID=A0ABU3PWU0_9ACTN|nr:MarR family transcriptional regulator [Nocardioides zeae]MDT9593694.1 MarR family transcriptional regulator [Nocardioides zeae]
MDDDLLRALGAEVMRIAARRTEGYAGSVLDYSAFRVLWRLADDGPRTLGELGEALQLERSTVSRQVRGCVDRGLVERVAGDDDRSHRVRATAAGLEAYRHDLAVRGVAWSGALSALGEERAYALVRDLRAFNDGLDAARGRPAR